MSHKLLVLLVFFLTSCATHKLQKVSHVPATTLSSPSNLSHRFYLIGDAGNTAINETSLPLTSLQKRLANAPVNSSVLFLGDNIYNNGLPNRTDSGYNLALHRINTQINAVKNYKGNVVFLPGNHDYCRNCDAYLKQQENYITTKLGATSFLPKNGCPLTSKNVSKDILLLIINSQWFLEDWNKNISINHDCAIKTREDFFMEFESLINSNTNKSIIITMHHPVMTDGPHGGQFTLQDHIFPYKNTPLPIVGHAVNFLRKTGGIYPQDLQNKNYTYFANRLKKITQNNNRVIFASGHEHSLQYLENNSIQIISGSGSKASGVKRSPNSLFSYGALGYSILDIYKDGTTQVQFIETATDSDTIAFSKNIFPAYPKNTEKVYPKITKKIQKAKILTSYKSNTKNESNTKLWGKQYRKEYGIEITAPIVSLDTLHGGLTPINQDNKKNSSSLYLKNKLGKQWGIHSLKKEPPSFFKSQTLNNDDYKNTLLKRSLENISTAIHPYTALAIPNLSKAIHIMHTKPSLYYIPKQKALGYYNKKFGDALYTIEEVIGDNRSNDEQKTTINTQELFNKLVTNHSNKVDEKLYLRTRLFDMLIGDWDKNEKQWAWNVIKTDSATIHKPIPLNRTQAFSNYDGLLFKILTRVVPSLKSMEPYSSKIRSIAAHNAKNTNIDSYLLKSLSLDDWIYQANYIKTYLTDDVIDRAFKALPIETQNDNLNIIKDALKKRRDNINTTAESYYKMLNASIVLTATHKKDNIVITRLENNATKIQFYNNDTLYFENTYTKKTTKEIWVYALNGDDTITINGIGKKHIKIKVLGGQGKDDFTVNNDANVTLHDFKTKNNATFKTHNTRIRLIDDYNTNTYDYTKRKHNTKHILPSIGVNKDDGVYLGLDNTFTYKNLRRNPFTHKHHLITNYLVRNSGFNFSYTGIFGNIINNNKKTNIKLHLAYNSPNFTNNFFGLGNETVNKETFLGLNYNRVKLTHAIASLGLLKYGLQGSSIEGTILFESNQIANTPDRYLVENYNQTIFKRKLFAGANIRYEFKNYNHKTTPTKGLNIKTFIGYRINPNSMKQQFAFLKPMLAFTHTITNNKRLVLDNKTQGHFTFGNNFEFYQAANAGADTGLRGFRFQRFTGKHAFTNSSDLSFNLKRFQSGIAPLNVGIFTALDFGRVWVKNDTSNKWHNDYGMGLWLRFAEIVTAKFGTFNSDEELLVVFKLGVEL